MWGADINSFLFLLYCTSSRVGYWASPSQFELMITFLAPQCLSGLLENAKTVRWITFKRHFYLVLTYET